MPEVFLYRLAGFTNPPSEKWTRQAFEIFQYLPGKYPDEDFLGARVKGVITLEIRRAVLLKTAPLRPGVSIDRPRRHYTLQSAEVTPEAVQTIITSTSIQSKLRGDYPGLGNWENFTWFVYNRRLGDYLKSEGGGSRWNTNFLYNSGSFDGNLHRQAIHERWKEAERPFPPDWKNGAEISFYTSELCGRISLPYEVESADLEH